mmetsp:Transcript_13819/g.32276  ORF Transcript_13819/g.32276 Transcript_13819/m.32276 type:complete len:115 (-) Transcript_13819:253-597(-)
MGATIRDVQIPETAPQKICFDTVSVSVFAPSADLSWCRSQNLEAAPWTQNMLALTRAAVASGAPIPRNKPRYREDVRAVDIPGLAFAATARLRFVANAFGRDRGDDDFDFECSC